MSNKREAFKNTLRYLVLERRVQITLPRKSVNEEARGDYGYIVEVIESADDADFYVIVETDDGDQYTCHPSALEIARHHERFDEDPHRRIEKKNNLIDEALSVSVLRDGGQDYPNALSDMRTLLVKAREV